jgi:hypothetical protein
MAATYADPQIARGLHHPLELCPLIGRTAGLPATVDAKPHCGLTARRSTSMNSRRPYRDALGIDAALNEIGSGTGR